MQHSLVFIFSRTLMMIFTKTFFMLISLDTALGVSYYHKIVTMSLNEKKVIKSPGYPRKNYERNTNYTWCVIASDDTEEISIEIKIDIHEVPGFRCDDYLQKCGQLTTKRTAIGNRLFVTLISNDDKLTSKGFQLTLKVLKVGTTLTTRSTSTQSTTTKTRTTASTVKTTTRNISKARSTKSTLTKRTTSTSTLLPSTAKPLKASTVKVLMSSTTTTMNTTTQSMMSTTPLTTRKIITTTPNMTLTTNATPLLTKSRTSLTSTETASTLRTTDENIMLLIGLGVLEVSLIVVGVLAVQRYRQKRNSNPSRQACKRNDDHTNRLKRENSCGETNVYDEIDIDDVKEEKEENPYKELPEGVYDTTLKRRSYLKVVGERKSNYSRGSIINMFRTSSFFRRKVNETSVMTFSSFKGPIQSQIGEKKKSVKDEVI